MSNKIKNRYFFTIVSILIVFSIYLLYERVFIKQDFIIQEQ
jgi:hypothetical protein